VGFETALVLWSACSPTPSLVSLESTKIRTKFLTVKLELWITHRLMIAVSFVNDMKEKGLRGEK